MVSSQVPSISLQSLICLVREISLSKIKVCFWCRFSDIHANPTKCSVVMNTVPKYLGSPSLYSGSENMRRHSKVSFDGCAWDVQDLLPWVWATWLSHSHSWLQFTTSGDPPVLCWFPQPQSPWQYPCPTPPAVTWHPLHSPPTYTKYPLEYQWDQASRFLLPNAEFQMVSTQNQESDQIFLKTSPVSFKMC